MSRFRRLGWLYGVLLLCNTAAHAQVLNSAQIGQRLDRLAVVGSVLYIAAHPDDENTQLLAWLAQDKHYRTAYLSLTRGDGGQNLLGHEQDASLGLIRIQELLAARREDGTEQFFSRAKDFGFSKRAEETLSIWDESAVLADMVWLIRRLQPDVIITRFPGDARAGHGHHQASSRLALQAFRAAGDPTQFPEQLRDVKPWQAKRLLWNTWKSFLSSGDTTAPDQLRIDVGSYNPRLGYSYGEIAALSRNHHKSQGFGSLPLRGHVWETFALLDGAPANHDLMEGIDTSWKRIPNSKKITKQIETLSKTYNSAAPAESLPQLLALNQSVQSLPASIWREQKLKEISQLIVACAGIWVGSYAESPLYSLGETIAVHNELVIRSNTNVRLESINGQRTLQPLPKDEIVQVSSTLKPTNISQPYWLEQPATQGSFIFTDRKLLEQPFSAQVPSVEIVLSVNGHLLTLRNEIQHQHLDPLRGQVLRPIQVTPPVTIELENQAYLFTDDNSQEINVHLHGLAPTSNGQLEVEPPPGWHITPLRQEFSVSAGQKQTLPLKIQPPANTNTSPLSLQVNVNGQRFNLSQVHIDYPHIPALDWFPNTNAQLVRLDLQRSGKQIAYIPGSGDKLPATLRQLGYQVTELDTRNLSTQTLSHFDAIITGIRAYNVDQHFAQAHPALMNYVQAGGILLVQYNTLSPKPPIPLGPYPFTISRDRVSEEDAPVRLLDPQHKLLNYPNHITAEDFNGWVQERGLYFAKDIDPRYQILLGMHDAGEDELTGSLISTEFGKGRFIYAPLSFFRQLPAGVPGAVRLFVNLLSH